jgi:hypothetical protein
MTDGPITTMAPFDWIKLALMGLLFWSAWKWL